VWHYFSYNQTDVDKEKLPLVTGFGVCLLSKDFAPEKYEALGRLLVSVYAGTGEVMNVLQAYMKVFVSDVVDAGPYGSFNADEHTLIKSVMNCSIKEIITTFGLETVLIWNAMLLGKRVVVYGETQDAVVRVVRTLPLFVWHKKDWSKTRPYVRLTDEEVADLKNVGASVAGFTDAAALSREDLFDVALNLADRTVAVASHATGDFAMGTFVKDLATFLVDAGADADMADKDVIKGLAVKTGELLTRLRGMGHDAGGKQRVTREDLQAKNLPPALERFLYNVARAESLTD